MVAVVIPAWNQAEITRDCIQSLLASDYDELRVIVVDNGSDDGFADSIQELASNLIIVRSETNRGFARGANLGIQYALKHHPDHLLLLNNDTIVDAHMISALVRTAETHPEYHIFSPLITFFDQPERVWFGGGEWDSRRRLPIHMYARQSVADVPARVFPIDWASGCALFANVAMFQQVGLLDPAFYAYWEDVDWCFRASSLGYRCAVQPEARVVHRVSATFGGKESPQSVYLYMRNRLLVIRKHIGLGQARKSAIGQTVMAVRMVMNGAIRRDHKKVENGFINLHATIDGIMNRSAWLEHHA